MSVSPISPLSSSPSSNESYFNQASTRWDIIKFLVPFVILIAAFLVSLYYTQQAQSQDIGQQTVRIATFQDAKESRGERLIVVETKVGSIVTRLDRMEEKIDTLLQRIPAK